MEKYSQEGAYPFHMPGHKRNVEGVAPFLAQWFARDLTEIPGMDDLHEPEGILKEAQERAAALYGAQQSFFLVNGSTAGVLAAISAAVRKGGTILMQRASHRSAYHAVQLRDLKVRYLYGKSSETESGSMAYGIGRVVTLEEICQTVEADPAVEAVFLTSPSYDGFSADLAQIADYLHAKDIPLLVDAAHGAHLGFSEDFPQSAVQAGADVVVMSVHKTLPAPTQTALLHLTGGRIPAERIQRFLDIYQTSSPSYPLMAAIDDCVQRVSGWDDDVWKDFMKRRKRLSEQLHRLERIGVWDSFGRSHVPGMQDRQAEELKAGMDMPEPGKILLFPPENENGVVLGRWLAEQGVQCEMALPAYVLLICTVSDTEAGYEKLAGVLRQADHLSFAETEKAKTKALFRVLSKEAADQTEMTIGTAAELPAETADPAGAAGRISAAFVSVYPPGQPILVPGERITEAKVKEIEALLLAGAAVQGML